MTRSICILCLLMMACNRPDAPDCFQTAGNAAIERRTVEAFSQLELRDYIHYEFHPGEESYLEIEGPANLLSDVTTGVENGRLLVRNQNTCNFVRSFKNRIVVRFFGPLPREVDHFATGDVSCADTLRGHFLVWNNRHAAGKVMLLSAIDTLSLQMHTGVASISVAGRALQLELYNSGLGVLDARNCPSMATFVNNSSISDIYTHPLGYFFVLINERGNVYYTGEPTAIDRTGEGDGELHRLP